MNNMKKGLIAVAISLGIGLVGCSSKYSVPPTGPRPVPTQTANTPTGTSTITNTFTHTATNTTTSTPTVNAPYTPTQTATPTDTHFYTSTDTPTSSFTFTSTETPTHTLTNTATVTHTPTNTSTLTNTPTFTFTPTPIRKNGSTYSGFGTTESVAVSGSVATVLEPTFYTKTNLSFVLPGTVCSPLISGKDIAGTSSNVYELDSGSLPPHVWVRANNSCNVDYILEGGSLLTSSSKGLAVASDGSAWISDGARVKQISLGDVLLNNIDLGSEVNAITTGNGKLYAALGNGTMITMNENGTSPVTFASPVTGIVDMAYNSNLNSIEALVSDRAYVINPTTMTMMPGGTYGLGSIVGGKGIWVENDDSYIVDSTNQVKEFPRY